KPIEEAQDLVPCGLLPLVGERVELGEAAVEAVRDPDVPAAQRPHELHIVVARHGHGGAVVDHVASDPETVEDARSAVDEIADEYRLATYRMCVHGPAVGELALAPLDGLVAEQCE